MAESVHLYGVRIPAGVRIDRVSVPATSPYQPVPGPAGCWVVAGRDGWGTAMVALELLPGATPNARPPSSLTVSLVGPSTGLSLSVSVPRFELQRPSLGFGKRTLTPTQR